MSNRFLVGFFGFDRASLLLALLIMGIILFPWPAPLPEARLAEFDPHLLAIDLRGHLSRPGKIRVSPRAVVLDAVRQSQPSVHVLTAEVPFSAEFTVQVTQMTGGAFPFQAKVWDPRSEVAVEGWYGPDGVIRVGLRQHNQWLRTRRLGKYVSGEPLRWYIDWDGRRVSFAAGNSLDRVVYVIEPNGATRLGKAAALSLTVYASVPEDGVSTVVISDPLITVPRQARYATRVQSPVFQWSVGLFALLSLVLLFSRLRARGISLRPSIGDLVSVLALLALVLLVSWRLASTPGHPIDTRAAVIWSHIAAQQGPQEITGRSLLGSGLAGEGVAPIGSVAYSYPPMLTYLFWGLGKTVAPEMVVKTLKMLAASAVAIGGSGLFLLFRHEGVAWPAAFLASCAYALNPAILFDSVVWGQTDAFVALALLLGAGGVVLQSAPMLWSGGLLAALTKQTGILFLPILITVGASRLGVRRLMGGLAPAILITFLILTPLLLTGMHPAIVYRPLITKGLEFGSVRSMDATNAVVSQSAFTLWSAVAGLEGMRGLERLAAPDYVTTRLGLSYFTLSRILFGVFALVIAFLVFRKHQRHHTGGILLAIAAYSAGAGILLTRVQPRYLFFAVIFTAGAIPWFSRTVGGTVLAVLSGTMLVAMWGMSVFTSIWYPGWLVNFQPERSWLNQAMVTVLGSDLGITIAALLNTAAVLALLVALWVNSHERPKRTANSQESTSLSN